MSENVITRQGKTVETPSFITLLFTDKRFAILWLPIRVWLGMQWVEASLHKLSDPAWVKTGLALKGFWTGAVQIPAEGRPCDHVCLVSGIPSNHAQRAGLYLVRQGDCSQ